MLAKMFLFDTSPQRKSLGRDACCMPKPLRETYRHASSLLSLIIQPEHQKYYRSGFQSMTPPAKHSTKRKKRKVACNRNKRKHRQKYLIPMENDRELFSSQLLNQGLAVRFDPPKDGNCQFSALCNQLTQIGIFSIRQNSKGRAGRVFADTP